METELELLIDHFETEIAILEKNIRENVEMGFYEDAQGNYDLLVSKKRQLSALYNIQTKNFSELKYLKEGLSRLEERKGEIPDFRFEYQKEKYESGIKLLETESTIFHPDSQQLYDALFWLDENKSGKITLVLIEKQNYKVEVFLQGRGCRLNFFPVMESPKFLKFLGFTLADDCFYKDFERFEKETFEKIYQLIAVIVFELIEVQCLDKPAKIILQPSI